MMHSLDQISVYPHELLELESNVLSTSEVKVNPTTHSKVYLSSNKMYRCIRDIPFDFLPQLSYPCFFLWSRTTNGFMITFSEGFHADINVPLLLFTQKKS